MTLKGSYNDETSYSVNDVVQWTDGTVYILRKPCASGTPPTVSLYWERVPQVLIAAVNMILNGVSMAEAAIPELADNLTTATSGKALDAKQGKKLQDEKLAKANVYNDLDKNASGYALDARQGKALKGTIDGFLPDSKTLRLASSTASSTKIFDITVDDSGELAATEYTPPATT